MSRRHLAFPCASAQLVGTLDEAPGSTGLLIVSGGNETRAGAFSGQAQLAARIAAAGFPVFRFDRRGVGDSEGPNAGFHGSAPDIAAALAAFRSAAPQVTRIVGFGNCDAASALMLGGGTELDALVLANPWTIGDGGDDVALPPAAIRSRYFEKLRNPKELLRLLSGKVSLSGVVRSLGQSLRPAPPPSSLAQAMAAGLARFAGPVAILLAERDRTAQLFDATWPKDDQRVARCPDAGHGFARPHAREWLCNQLLAALAQE